MTLTPQAYRKLEFTHRAGVLADRPAASAVLVGTLYFSTDTGELHRSDGSAWHAYAPTVPATVPANTLRGRGDSGAGALEAITLSPGLIMTGTELSVRTGVFNYVYNTTLTEPPTAGQVRLDTLHPWTTASKMWLRFTSGDGQDLYWGIMIVPVGATVILQDKDDHTRYGRFLTTGVPIDKGIYAELPLAFVASGLAIVTAQQVFLRVTGV